MSGFLAPFWVIDERGCPFYSVNDNLLLTDKAILLPVGQPTCLILARQITELLFELMPEYADGFGNCIDKVYTCGGCTGLIKFKLKKDADGIDLGEPVMSGLIDSILPAELLQVFHMHQKTGVLFLDLEGGTGRVAFRSGQVVSARFDELDNKEAIYSILEETEGFFRFYPELPDHMKNAAEIGDFMMILMEGLKRMDEVDY